LNHRVAQIDNEYVFDVIAQTGAADRYGGSCRLVRDPALRSHRLRALQFVSQRVERTSLEGCAQRCGPRNILEHLLTGYRIDPNE